MKPLMPDETLAKIKLLSKPSHPKQHADVFGPELFDWLMAEVIKQSIIQFVARICLIMLTL